MTSARRKAFAIAPAERRSLSRTQAAEYIGVPPIEFDALVGDGKMPPPRRLNNRLLWDRREIDFAYDDLPHEKRQLDERGRVDPHLDLAV